MPCRKKKQWSLYCNSGSYCSGRGPVVMGTNTNQISPQPTDPVGSAKSSTRKRKKKEGNREEAQTTPKSGSLLWCAFVGGLELVGLGLTENFLATPSLTATWPIRPPFPYSACHSLNFTAFGATASFLAVFYPFPDWAGDSPDCALLFGPLWPSHRNRVTFADPFPHC